MTSHLLPGASPSLFPLPPSLMSHTKTLFHHFPCLSQNITLSLYLITPITLKQATFPFLVGGEKKPFLTLMIPVLLQLPPHYSFISSLPVPPFPLLQRSLGPVPAWLPHQFLSSRRWTLYGEMQGPVLSAHLISLVDFLATFHMLIMLFALKYLLDCLVLAFTISSSLQHLDFRAAQGSLSTCLWAQAVSTF